MELTSLATVSFCLAKIVMRLAGAGTVADAVDDSESGVKSLRGLSQRRITKSLAQELERDLGTIGSDGLPDHDRRAALGAVDQFLQEFGGELAVQAVLPHDLGAWAFSHGAGDFRDRLGGNAGDYFEQVLRRCLLELKRRSPGTNFLAAAQVHMIKQFDAVRGQLEELRRDTNGQLKRDALARVTSAAAWYARELELPEGQYVVRTIEANLLEQITTGATNWPRVVVGEAGAGKSTLLWSIQNELYRAGYDPILVSAAWILADPQHLKDVMLASALYREFGSPVLLIDTVDLMLHQEEQRQNLLAFIEQTYGKAIPAVYVTRPQERPLIHHPELREIELGLYDDRELESATRALASRYCPNANAQAVHAGASTSVARGLSAADVCRSPLLLRMLFEASSPYAPEFTDLDVTSLYDSYWNRRVVRDARTEYAVSVRVSRSSDLSSIAGTTAAALLILGLPQEREVKVQAVIGCLEPTLLSEDSVQLIERGIATRSADSVGFFHQTMFEYAFARWWLTSRDPDLLGRLVERTRAGLGDLFVGAALEQTLILTARSHLAEGQVRAACQQLVEQGNSGSCQAIGLAVWAHRSSALVLRPGLLRQCDDSALVRTARLLPSVGGKPVGETISQLLMIWEAKDSSAVRVAVLRALKRVALNDPDTVVQALEHLYPMGGLPIEPTIVPQEDEPDFVARARRIADVPTDELVESFIDLFDTLPDTYATVVRRLCVSLLQRSQDARVAILGFLSATWQRIGSQELLYQAFRAVGFPTELPNSLLAPCGQLLAQERFRTVTSAQDLEAFMYLRREEDGEYGTVLEISALGALAGMVEDKVLLDRAICELLSVDDFYQGPGKISLQSLLFASRHARERFAGLAQQAVAELLVDGVSPLSARVLAFLANVQVPAVTYLRSFDGVTDWQWGEHPELLSLLVQSASFGVSSAERTLETFAGSPQLLSAAQVDVLFSSVRTIKIGSDVIFESVLRIALAFRDVSTVRKLVGETSISHHRWNSVQAPVLSFVEELLHDPERRDEGLEFQADILATNGAHIPWSVTRTALEMATENQQTAILGGLWKRREDKNFEAERIAYLEGIVAVRPGAAIPVDRATPVVSLGLLTTAANSLFNIIVLSNDASEEYWPMVRTLSFYQPLHDMPYTLGTSFAATCRYLELLGEQKVSTMPSMLQGYLSDISEDAFLGITPTLWTRELTNAVNHAITIGGAEVASAICDLAAQTPIEVSKALVIGLSGRWYNWTRNSLINLANSAPQHALQELCQQLVRDRDRSAGTRAFPDFVPGISECLVGLA